MNLVQIDVEEARPAEGLLHEAIAKGVPLVGIFGQQAGWTDDSDPVLRLALARVDKSPSEGWKGLLSRTPLPDHFDAWLEERFARRAPSSELISITDAPFSAVFTSSVDPGWANLLASGGREPGPILIVIPYPLSYAASGAHPFSFCLVALALVPRKQGRQRQCKPWRSDDLGMPQICCET
jgi:hypothetical protein